MGSESDECQVILGVDGGTTSTVCVCMPLLPFSDIHILPDPLPILGRAIAGCSNFNSVGGDVARETLEKVIAEALFDAGVKQSAVKAVCLGLSGVNNSKDQEKILGWLSLGSIWVRKWDEMRVLAEMIYYYNSIPDVFPQSGAWEG
ncbi:putative auxin response factor 17-like [Capsicum annuum]|nr:putative auxin response factor 17-like [Capsicum annuum]